MISNNVILLVWYSMVCLVSVKITNGRSNIPSLICKTFASLGFLLQLIMMRHKSEIACAPLWKVHKTTALTLQISTYAFICLSRDSCTCTSRCLEYFPKKWVLQNGPTRGPEWPKGPRIAQMMLITAIMVDRDQNGEMIQVAQNKEMPKFGSIVSQKSKMVENNKAQNMK